MPRPPELTPDVVLKLKMDLLNEAGIDLICVLSSFFDRHTAFEIALINAWLKNKMYGNGGTLEEYTDMMEEIDTFAAEGGDPWEAAVEGYNQWVSEVSN